MIKVEKLKNHNWINDLCLFFGTGPRGRVSLEVKLLKGALGGPHELLGAPNGPPEAPQRSEMAKNDHQSKKIGKP